MKKLTREFIVVVCAFSLGVSCVLLAAYKILTPPDYLPPSEPPAFIKTSGQAEYETTPLIDHE